MAARKLVNAVAPGLTGALSAAEQEAVAAYASGARKNPWATPDAAALRRHDESRDVATPLRPAYMRDAEKIMHLPAYNRLAGKTQVFSFTADEDLARRGLHVQLVSRVARDIGRALGLNVDLIEAISLGHDIGHTPFGHAGETFLDESLRRRTGRRFFHNVHSVRVLDRLYGRNLTLQTLDGILCHNGASDTRLFTTSGLSDFDAFDAVVSDCVSHGKDAVGKLRPMTLEGCAVRLADIVAYVGKDRQDALRARHVAPGAFDDGLDGAYNSWALEVFISDIVANSLGRDHLAMSEEGFAELKRAKQENYDRIYSSTEIHGARWHSVADLFDLVYATARDDLAAGRTEAPVFVHHVAPVNDDLAHYGRSYRWEDDLDQTVVDYVAGMTDDYFMALAQRLDPVAAFVFPQHNYFDGLTQCNPGA